MPDVKGYLKSINIFGLVFTTKKRIENMHIEININKDGIDNFNKGLSYYNGEWINETNNKE